MFNSNSERSYKNHKNLKNLERDYDWLTKDHNSQVNELNHYYVYKFAGELSKVDFEKWVEVSFIVFKQ